MPWWAWVMIAVAAIVLIAAVAWSAFRQRRTQRLRSLFGPEYERTLRSANDRRAGESELSEREKRRAQLDIRPLDPAARERHSAAWRLAQERFVDDPSAAVKEADALVTVVMQERGYPMADFDRRAADVSVDHPQVVEDYRAAHRISMANDRGEAETEDLRQAMTKYRALFMALLGPASEGEEPGSGKEQRTA